MRSGAALAIASVLLLTTPAAAQTANVSTSAPTYYVLLEDGTASVWAEANGVAGLQRAAVLGAPGEVVTPADERVTPIVTEPALAPTDCFGDVWCHGCTYMGDGYWHCWRDDVNYWVGEIKELLPVICIMC